MVHSNFEIPLAGFSNDTVKNAGVKKENAIPNIHAESKKKKDSVNNSVNKSGVNNSNATQKNTKKTQPTPEVKTNIISTPTPSPSASVVKTGLFIPPEILRDFQIIKMKTKQNPILEIGGIRFYAPNSENKELEAQNITSKIVGENTIITVGSGNNASTVIIPNALAEKNEANGAAVIYDQKAQTYAFCNLEGASVEFPKQEAGNKNVVVENKTINGEKVFIQGCKGTTFDTNDTIDVTNGGTARTLESNIKASSGSMESFAVLDSEVEIKASGNDKIYVQNSLVGIKPSLENPDQKIMAPINSAEGNANKVLVASDSSSKINIDYGIQNPSQTKFQSVRYQTGHDAATFVPAWFGSDQKLGAQIDKKTALATTAAQDGSNSVSKTGTFAPDSRYPEFNVLNMQAKQAFKSEGGLSFFAPNVTDTNKLADLVTIREDEKNFTFTLKSESKQTLKEGAYDSKEGFTTITIPKEHVEENKKNGASVVFDPKTQTFAYCNLSNAEITGAYQESSYNDHYADKFTLKDKKLSQEGEKVYMRNCSNVKINSNDIIGVGRDYRLMPVRTASDDPSAKSYIGSGSQEKYVAIGCDNIELITSGDGDIIRLENSKNFTIKAAETEEKENKLYNTAGEIGHRAESMKIDVNTDETSSLSLNFSQLYTKLRKASVETQAK